MILGFTGSRLGMTASQSAQVRDWFERNSKHVKYAVHGACYGADEQFHRFCMEFGVDVHLRPGAPRSKRCKQTEDSAARMAPEAKVIHAVEPYLDRNRKIIEECDWVMACPNTSLNPGRGGTWYTIEFARKFNRTLLLIPPGVPVEMEVEDFGSTMENCCKCFAFTKYWYRKNDVALCPECADRSKGSDIPTKAEWFAEFERRRKAGRIDG